MKKFRPYLTVQDLKLLSSLLLGACENLALSPQVRRHALVLGTDLEALLSKAISGETKEATNTDRDSSWEERLGLLSEEERKKKEEQELAAIQNDFESLFVNLTSKGQ